MPGTDFRGLIDGCSPRGTVIFIDIADARRYRRRRRFRARRVTAEYCR